MGVRGVSGENKTRHAELTALERARVMKRKRQRERERESDVERKRDRESERCIGSELGLVLGTVE